MTPRDLIKPKDVTSSTGKISSFSSIPISSSMSCNYLSTSRKKGRKSKVGPLMSVARPFDDRGESTEDDEDKINIV